MTMIGENIVEMEKLINTVLSPPPRWIRRWHMDASDVLAMAHFAKDENNIDKLRLLDEEAKKLIEIWREKTALK